MAVGNLTLKKKKKKKGLSKGELQTGDFDFALSQWESRMGRQVASMTE